MSVVKPIVVTVGCDPTLDESEICRDCPGYNGPGCCAVDDMEPKLGPVRTLLYRLHQWLAS